MIPKLSKNAQKVFDEYINQARLSLRGIKSVDAEEIVQNINEHIGNELSACREPVSSEELGDVLTKLGSPQQWVPEEEISWWRKFILRIRTGPEDWRLAYLAFGLFVAGLLFHTPFSNFMILITASFVVSRAAIITANNRGELRGQKWLIYPSLVVVYLPLLLFLLTWPLIPIFNLWVPKYSSLLARTLGSEDLGSIESISFIVAIVISAASLGVIWTGYGLILLSQKRQILIRTIFKPFGNRFGGKWDMVFIFTGIALFALSIITAFIINYFELIPIGLLPDRLFF